MLRLGGEMCARGPGRIFLPFIGIRISTSLFVPSYSRTPELAAFCSLWRDPWKPLLHNTCMKGRCGSSYGGEQDDRLAREVWVAEGKFAPRKKGKEFCWSMSRGDDTFLHRA